MCDFANFLCCFNNQRIFCLEYECLFITILIFICNFLGLLMISWDLVKFYCEIIYSVNLPIITFSFVIISLVIFSTLKGRINSNDVYKSFSFISIMITILYIYLFIIYIICSIQIISDYSQNYNMSIYNIFKSKGKEAIKKNEYSQLGYILVIIFFVCILPLILSFVNVLIWMSIYYRIYYKIYCSFKKEIRKELRKQNINDKQFIEVKEDNLKKVNLTSISIVFKKDRHPARANNIEDNNINIQKKQLSNRAKNRNFKAEYNQLDANSIDKLERKSEKN